MCLAIPMKILEIQGTQGSLEVGGVIRSVDLSLVSPVSVGQYVIVHAGFAIAILQEDEAQKTLALFKDTNE
ncbi:MAG: HypC/HybG/HupF family hydrogenase formation chaperone [Bdellovibrionota bacterium]